MTPSEDGFAFGDLVGVTNILDLELGVSEKLGSKELFWRGVVFRVGDKIFSGLSIEVVAFPVWVEDVSRDGNAVGLLVFLIGVNEDSHGGREVIDAIKFAFFVCAVVPKAGPDLFDAFADMTLVVLMGE